MVVFRSVLPFFPYQLLARCLCPVFVGGWTSSRPTSNQRSSSPFKRPARFAIREGTGAVFLEGWTRAVVIWELHVLVLVCTVNCCNPVLFSSGRYTVLCLMLVRYFPFTHAGFGIGKLPMGLHSLRVNLLLTHQVRNGCHPMYILARDIYGFLDGDSFFLAFSLPPPLVVQLFSPLWRPYNKHQCSIATALHFPRTTSPSVLGQRGHNKVHQWTFDTIGFTFYLLHFQSNYLLYSSTLYTLT